MQIKLEILQGRKPEMAYITGVKNTINSFLYIQYRYSGKKGDSDNYNHLSSCYLSLIFNCNQLLCKNSLTYHLSKTKFLSSLINFNHCGDELTYQFILDRGRLSFLNCIFLCFKRLTLNDELCLSTIGTTTQCQVRLFLGLSYTKKDINKKRKVKRKKLKK